MSPQTDGNYCVIKHYSIQKTKLKGSDGRVTLFGDRSGTWLDETEQGEFAGLEEQFAIVHKATLHVIRQERDKDARPKPRARITRTQQVKAAIEAGAKAHGAAVELGFDESAAIDVKKSHGNM